LKVNDTEIGTVIKAEDNANNEVGTHKVDMHMDKSLKLSINSDKAREIVDLNENHTTTTTKNGFECIQLQEQDLLNDFSN